MDDPTPESDGVSRSLAAVAADVGVTAWVHAFRVGEPQDSISLGGDEPVAMASLYKVPLALAWASLVEARRLDPLERIRLAPGSRSAGPSGIAMLLDEVAVTQRDAVRLMLAISDNACADAIFELVGHDRLAGILAGHGLADIDVRHGAGASWRVVQRETGAEDLAAAQRALGRVESDVLTSEYDAALASAATARSMCRVLDVLWAQKGAAHALVRDAMARQPWRHRLGSGFPHDDVTVQAKTGTLGRLRHEAAVITYPDEHPIAVTVMTRAARPEQHQPRVDAAIGELARLAVTPLRRASDAQDQR